MSLPHVLLGLLTRGAASGWDLKARMTRDAALGWDAELPQIYGELRRLLRGGFVSFKRRPSRHGPPRREYRITAEGRREFLHWLAEPLAPARPRDATLARLAFLERQPPALRAERLLTYRGLVVLSMRSVGALVSASRRRRRALLERELVWIDAECALLARDERERAAEASSPAATPA